MNRELLVLESIESLQHPSSTALTAAIGEIILAASDQQPIMPVGSESFVCPNGGTCSSGFCNGGSDCLEIKNPWPKPEQ